MQLNIKPLKRKMPLYQQAYTEIKKAILTGNITQGTKISENVLADQFQISRTPLREAIRQLQQEGLLISDGVSTSVVELNSEDFEELCYCRLILEKEVIKLSIEQISDEDINVLEKLMNQAEKELRANNYLEVLVYNSQFHDLINLSCGNKRLIQLLNQTRSFLLLYRANALLKADNKLQTISEHREIINSIRQRDINKATKAIEIHLKGDLQRGSQF